MAQKDDITADVLVSVSAGVKDMHEEVRRLLRMMIHYMLGYKRAGSFSSTAISACSSMSAAASATSI